MMKNFKVTLPQENGPYIFNFIKITTSLAYFYVIPIKMLKNSVHKLFHLTDKITMSTEMSTCLRKTYLFILTTKPFFEKEIFLQYL